MGTVIRANHTKYNMGRFEDPENDLLAVATVNATPELLAIYGAACPWRADLARADSLIALIDKAREDTLAVTAKVAKKKET